MVNALASIAATGEYDGTVELERIFVGSVTLVAIESPAGPESPHGARGARAWVELKPDEARVLAASLVALADAAEREALRRSSVVAASGD